MRVRGGPLLFLLSGLLDLMAPVATNKDKNKDVNQINEINTSRRVRLRGVKWWNLAHSADRIQTDYLLPSAPPVFINPSVQTLTRKQRRLVNKNPGTTLAIATGARIAVEECQYQFHQRRWNCPIADSSHGGSIFGKILKKGVRETAFIYAVTSAALAHSVARSCSQGSILTCTCGAKTSGVATRTAQSDWKWGGCSDNAVFGHRFSREFVDEAERGRDLRYMMDLHNSEAGRLQVSREMSHECKCHGMSGSCTLKTCWMRLPTFRKVGVALKDKFDGASKVITGNSPSNRDNNINSKRSRRRSRINLLPTNPNHKTPGPRDLVYYETSPNFCERDKSIGFKGTKGRECNATSIGVQGCDLMCCGRGFKSVTYTARERCHCTFHWCCQVTCKICTKIKLKHMCL